MIDPAARTAALPVPLNGFTMQLRPSELESVAAGLGQDHPADPLAIVEALRRLPANDRAPAWELALRRFGRREGLAQAAGEIGMDLPHARSLLEALFGLTAVVPPPERPAANTPP